MKKADIGLWKKQEAMYKLIETSFSESPADRAAWKRDTSRLLKPSTDFEGSNWEIEYAKDKELDGFLNRRYSRSTEKALH